MTMHRKLSPWLVAVNKQLARPKLEGHHSELCSLGMDAAGLFDQMEDDPGALREVITVLRQVREGVGVGRATFEEDCMRALRWMVDRLCGDLSEAGLARQPSLTLPLTIPDDLRAPTEVVLECCAYALDCLAFSRPRDALAGNRRRYALEILGSAAQLFEMPDSVMAFVRKTLKSGRPPALIGALVFCDMYKERDARVPAELQSLLLDVAKRTDRRGVASGALSVLVDAGEISEFEALDRIDDWKDRNYPWRRPAAEDDASQGA